MVSFLGILRVIAEPVAFLLVERIGQFCCRKCRGPDAIEAPRALRRQVMAEQGRLGGVCAICLVGLNAAWAPEEMGDLEVEIRACKHAMHLPCMTEWVKTNKSCPLCPHVTVVDQYIVRRPRKSDRASFDDDY